MAAVEITDNGAQVSAQVGDEIRVRVPENATTAYLWEVTEIGDSLELLSSEHSPPGRPGESAPGAQGERIFLLRATTPGDATLQLAKSRPWESTPVERFSARVVVR